MTHRKVLLATTMIIFLLMILNLPAFGGNFKISFGPDYNPAVSYNLLAQEYLVVYEHATSALNHDIYAMRIKDSGTLYGPYPIAVTSDSEINPKVTYNSYSGQYLVVWEREIGSKDHNILACRFDAGVNMVGSVLDVATESTLMETNPDVVYNAHNHQFMIAWEQEPYSSGNRDIYARTYSAGGKNEILTFPVTSESFDESAPAVTYDTTNEQYFVLWQGNPGAYYSVYPCRVSDSGSISTSLGIGSSGYDLLNPGVVWDRDSEQCLVVMESRKADHSEISITGQRLNGSGNLSGGLFEIAGEKQAFFYSPQVTYNPSVAECLVGYVSDDAVTGLNLYCKRMNPDPVKEFVIAAKEGNEWYPALVSGNMEAFFIVFQNDGSSNPKIYGERLSKPTGAATTPASTVTPFSATLNGQATPNGRLTTCYFEYGKSIAYGSVSDQLSIGSGTDPVLVHIPVDGLDPGTTYHFRLVAENDMGQDLGGDRLLRTPDAPPEIDTDLPVGQITTDSAAISGSITPNNTATVYWFRYWMDGTDESAADDTQHLSLTPGTTPVIVTANLSSLRQNTTYHFRLVATNVGGTVQSAFQTFTTLAEKYGFDGMWPKAIRPWYFNQPRSIKTDGSGNVYIADTLNHRIQKFSSNGHLLNQWGRLGNAVGEFNTPMGIALDSKGYIYVADTYNQRIQKFTLDGKYITSWQCPPVNLNDGFPFSIAVRSTGQVFVCIGGNKDAVEVFKEANGSYIYDFYFAPAGGSFTFTNGNDFDGNIDFWQDCRPETVSLPGGGTSTEMVCRDYLFLADPWAHQILKYGFDTIPEGQLITKFGSPGTGDGEFGGGGKGPSDIAVDEQGQVYALDPGNHRVQVFTPLEDSSGDYEFDRKWGRQDDEYAKFIEPKGIAVDSTNSVYVTDAQSYPVQKFLNTGSFMQRWAGNSFLPGAFTLPEGICFDESGNIYVADTGNHRIQKFNADMEPVGEWYKSGQTPVSWFPKDIAVSSDNIVYVLSADLVQKFNPAGVYLGDLNGRFPQPGGIAVDGNYLYVTESSLDKIYKYDRQNGLLVNSFTSPNPTSIAVDSSHNIYVTEAETCNIAKYDLNGGNIAKWGSHGQGDGQFAFGMKGITVGSDGLLYVADSYNHRIQMFTTDGQYINQFGGYGCLPSRFNVVQAVKMRSINNDKQFYLADTQNNRIQKFALIPPNVNNKAIILAGGGASENTLWESIKITADLASFVLAYQGFPLENVRYLSAESGNTTYSGNLIEASQDNLEDAITDWATDATSLTLFLTDHGGINEQGQGTFQINEEEVLDEGQLQGWLTTLQAMAHVPVNVVVDACYSGKFSGALQPESDSPRIVITSTGPDETALFSGQGWASFSAVFWGEIFTGDTIDEAYKGAKSQVEPDQNPILAVYNTSSDIYIGRDTSSQNRPVIDDVRAETLYGNTILTADGVTSDHGISRVWAVVNPMTAGISTLGSPILDYPIVEMTRSESSPSNQWNGTFNSFDQAAHYQLIFYAMDTNGITSFPSAIEYSNQPTQERKAIIIIGGSPSDENAAAYKANAEFAYMALRVQGYQNKNIEFLDPSDDLVNRPAVINALNAFKSGGTKDLVLYMVGPGTPLRFYLEDEYITAFELSTWLGDLKTAIIYDADDSGSFIQDVSKNNRIIISSTSLVGKALFSFDEESSFSNSFSKMFWTRVLSGTNVHDAYFSARNQIQLITDLTQQPEIDADGNTPCCSIMDGNIAREFIIGAHIQMAAASPLISSVGKDRIIYDNSEIIQADNVISIFSPQVKATIIGPGYPEPPDPIIKNLEPVSSQTYELNYPGFDTYGEYKVAVFAVAGGKTSLVKEISIFQMGAFEDIYEDDDTLESAKVIYPSGPVQQHNFFDQDAQDHEDWVKFDGIDGKKYGIKIKKTEENTLDLLITIFDWAGEEILNDGGSGFISFGCKKDAIYYIQVKNLSNTYGAKTGYDFSVFREEGGEPGDLKGIVVSQSGELVGGAQVILNLNNQADTSFQTTTHSPTPDSPGGGYGFYGIPSGTYSSNIVKTGYTHEPVTNVEVKAGTVSGAAFLVVPANPVLKGDINGDGKVDLIDRDMVIAVLAGGQPPGIRSDYVVSGADVNRDDQIGPEELIYILGIIP